MQIDEATYKRMPPHLQAMFTKLPNPGSDEVMEAFAAFGESKGDSPNRTPRIKRAEKFGWSGSAAQDCQTAGFSDTGTAARFYYTAKASKAERGDGNHHPTVKPLALMRWLVRLVCPPGGLILDPFAGSGTTGLAATAEGRRAILIEKEPAYSEIIRRRINPPAPAPAGPSLFDDLA